MDNELAPLEINLSSVRNGTLDESWLTHFSGAVSKLLGGMLGGYSVPTRIVGSQREITSFAKTLGRERDYLALIKELGLNDPHVTGNKAKVDQAAKEFLRVTGIQWPFK